MFEAVLHFTISVFEAVFCFITPVFQAVFCFITSLSEAKLCFKPQCLRLYFILVSVFEAVLFHYLTV
jgi:hypothetical protein